jgi:hypothetical protein
MTSIFDARLPTLTTVRLMAYASNRTYKERGSYRTGDRA